MTVGVGIAGLFAWVLGLSATLAEPALNALGITVQNLTNGAFKKSMLMIAVAFGVGTGIMLGVLKLIYGFHIMYILIPGYTLGLILTFLSTEEFVNVGWDSAGVTTGPVTVPTSPRDGSRIWKCARLNRRFWYFGCSLNLSYCSSFDAWYICSI